MSLAVRQMLIAGIIGLLVVIVVVRLSRRGQLSFRYTIGWIGAASFGILAGLFVPVKVTLTNGNKLSSTRVWFCDLQLMPKQMVSQNE